jgi:hypothetical protein
MRNLFELISESLDKYNDKFEAKWDRRLTRHVDAMSDRVTLRKYIYVLGGVNILLWLSVLARPSDVLSAFTKVANIDDRLVGTVLVGVFAVGMWLTYALFRFKFPSLEERNYSAGFMATYTYQLNWTRKFLIWVTSVAGGVLNLLALSIVLGLLVSERP